MKVHRLKSLITGIIGVLLFSFGSLSSTAGGFSSITKERSSELSNKTFYSSLATLRPLTSILTLDATVTTDKADYAPGSTVQISGAGFQAGETVTLQVTHTDGTAEGGMGHEPWIVTALDDGSFTSSWYVNPDDSVGSSFLLTA